MIGWRCTSTLGRGRKLQRIVRVGRAALLRAWPRDRVLRVVVPEQAERSWLHHGRPHEQGAYDRLDLSWGCTGTVGAFTGVCADIRVTQMLEGPFSV